MVVWTWIEKKETVIDNRMITVYIAAGCCWGLSLLCLFGEVLPPLVLIGCKKLADKVKFYWKDRKKRSCCRCMLRKINCNCNYIYFAPYQVLPTSRAWLASFEPSSVKKVFKGQELKQLNTLY